MAVGDDQENREIGSEDDDRSGIKPPPSPAPSSSWLIPLFVVTNVTLFSVAMFVNNCPKHSDSHAPNHHCVATFLGRLSFEPLGNNPLFGPSSRTLVKLGSLERCRVVEMHEAWRLFTCIWLHAGVIHLVTNMISLVFIVRIGVIYVISGVGGSIVSSLFIRNGVSVGASGPLFGLLGSMVSEILTNWTIYSNKVAALLTVLFVVVANLAVGILPHVDNVAHLGGFLVGFLLGFLLLARPQFKWLAREHIPQGRPLTSKYKTYQYILWLVSLALLISGFVVTLVMLFRGEDGNVHCSWCRYLRCIPTSRWICEE